MKAIALISGGLDSILAARVVKDQGIDVIPLNFRIPFCHFKPHSYLGRGLDSFVKETLGRDLLTVGIENEFLRLILSPEHGFGSHMNPCIDCKILMLAKSRELMPQLDAQFVVTGEVLGQRPMSQHKQALNSIEAKSGLKGLLLRPLCARKLPPTIPEEKGWIARERLMDYSGRCRRPQIKLAAELRISGYPNASGGCLLTDRQFSARLKDLIKYGSLDLRNIELLKFGRHFRINEKAKLIVGRNEEEDRLLEGSYREGDILFIPGEDTAGAHSLGIGEFTREEVILCFGITRRYCDNKESAEIICKGITWHDSASCRAPIPKECELAALRI